MYTFKGNRFQSVSISSRGSLPTLKVINQHCSGEIALFGGHLLSFIPLRDKQERLWMSPRALFDGSKPIRGGVPVCWPWFANLQTQTHTDELALPAHGFVRTQPWHVIKVEESDAMTIITLQPDQLGLFGFSEQLLVNLEVTFAKQCSIKLISTNMSERPATITAALHSYLNIADIHQTEIHGVAGRYIDKLRNSQTFEQGTPYLITGETDRIHLKDDSNYFDRISIAAPICTNIQQQGHDSVVIWNPWEDKSQSMPDMQDDGYLQMLCIEAAITQGHIVAAKQQHILLQVIS